MAKTDGGPAFPSVPDFRGGIAPAAYSEGLSIRDHFAGQALVGILANSHLTSHAERHAGDHPMNDNVDFFRIITEWANDFADDMLRARTTEVADD